MGVGAVLVSCAETFAKETGCYSIRLSSNSFHNFNFYRHLGYNLRNDGFPSMYPGEKIYYFEKNIDASQSPMCTTLLYRQASVSRKNSMGESVTAEPQSSGHNIASYA